MPVKTAVKIEKARISDVPQIHKLVNQFASNGEMLARPLSEIYENLRDFFVARQGRKVVGCAALHLMWSDLAEIKSVAVSADEQRLGLGNVLMEKCIAEAKSLGIATIFCFTYKPGFFAQVGFKEVDKMTLPHKVWTECLRCPKFPNCDEIAMTMVLGKK
ncbi:MAG TPA: N-acetyltransferase [Dehalococcoidales bacterium]|nr:N-acetyltransferase [Dehalococcoidales bacterium]